MALNAPEHPVMWEIVRSVGLSLDGRYPQSPNGRNNVGDIESPDCFPAHQQSGNDDQQGHVRSDDRFSFSMAIRMFFPELLMQNRSSPGTGL